MPPLPGGGETNYGGILEEDHGKGTVIHGETQRQGGLQREWIYAGGQIPVESSDDSTWEGGRETATMDYTGRMDGAPGLPHVLSGKGGTTDMPRVGVPGKSVDKDGNAGAFCAPACCRHCGDSGGRKLPTPTVSLVQHAVPTGGSEQAAPGDRTVSQRSRMEETAAGRGRDAQKFGSGV